MAWEMCPFDHGSAVSWLGVLPLHLFNKHFHPQLGPIALVTSKQDPSRAAGGARAISEAIDRIGLLGSRYLRRRLQSKEKQPMPGQP